MSSVAQDSLPQADKAVAHSRSQFLQHDSLVPQDDEHNIICELRHTVYWRVEHGNTQHWSSTKNQIADLALKLPSISSTRLSITLGTRLASWQGGLSTNCCSFGDGYIGCSCKSTGNSARTPSTQKEEVPWSAMQRSTSGLSECACVCQRKTEMPGLVRASTCCLVSSHSTGFSQLD